MEGGAGVNNYLDPDHWVNGGEHDFCDPMAKAFTELEEENKRLRAALERISKHDKIILGEHMDQVRQIAREALNAHDRGN